eukprot:4534091-Prorocentrum_lima.AAC.1
MAREGQGHGRPGAPKDPALQSTAKGQCALGLVGRQQLCSTNNSMPFMASSAVGPSKAEAHWQAEPLLHHS